MEETTGIVLGLVLLVTPACVREDAAPEITGAERLDAVTVPIRLDHNRMLVQAEMQRDDGGWRTVLLWVDSGNPELFISEEVAADLGIEPPAAEQADAVQEGQGASAEQPGGPSEVPPPDGVRIGGMQLDVTGVTTRILAQPKWLFTTMHIDANLPSTVLRRYRVVFDYPGRTLTLARPAVGRPRGRRAQAAVHPETGIVQIDAVIAGERLSFALDNGASYSFLSGEVLEGLVAAHPDWPSTTGALGCANIWGWWPGEAEWPIVRLPELQWGGVSLAGVGVAGVPAFFPDGSSLGAWYSQKTARPVDGILGPNAYEAFRVEIDFAGGAVYFDGGEAPARHDMDLVGLTIRPLEDGSYQVLGVAAKDGRPAVRGVEPGDTLLRVGDLEATGATMGSVVDALRGAPGDVRTLVLARDGERFTVEARVERFLE